MEPFLDTITSCYIHPDETKYIASPQGKLIFVLLLINKKIFMLTHFHLKIIHDPGLPTCLFT